MTSQFSELNSLLIFSVVVADNFLFAAPTSTSHAAASIFTHVDAATTLANLFSPLTGSTALLPSLAVVLLQPDTDYIKDRHT